MTKADRVISIIMLLLGRDIISASELSQIFNVSVRTIYRDVEDIQKAGIPVVASPGPAGGISILEQYKTERRLFTSNDITTFIINMSNAGSDFIENNRQTALMKLKAMISKEQLLEVKEWMTNPSSPLPTVAVDVRFQESCKQSFIALFGETIDITEENGWFFATVHIRDNEFGYSTLFLLNGQCECLAPEYVRKYLSKKIDEMKKLYEP